MLFKTSTFDSGDYQITKLINFIGFSYIFYVNFLSTRGKIEVTTQTIQDPRKRKVMHAKYQQTTLKDTFSGRPDIFQETTSSPFHLKITFKPYIEQICYKTAILSPIRSDK